MAFHSQLAASSGDLSDSEQKLDEVTEAAQTFRSMAQGYGSVA